MSNLRFLFDLTATVHGRCFTDQSRSTEKTTQEVFSISFKDLREFGAVCFSQTRRHKPLNPAPVGGRYLPVSGPGRVAPASAKTSRWAGMTRAAEKFFPTKTPESGYSADVLQRFPRICADPIRAGRTAADSNECGRADRKERVT